MYNKVSLCTTFSVCLIADDHRFDMLGTLAPANPYVFFADDNHIPIHYLLRILSRVIVKSRMGFNIAAFSLNCLPHYNKIKPGLINQKSHATTLRT